MTTSCTTPTLTTSIKIEQTNNVVKIHRRKLILYKPDPHTNADVLSLFFPAQLQVVLIKRTGCPFICKHKQFPLLMK